MDNVQNNSCVYCHRQSNLIHWWHPCHSSSATINELNRRYFLWQTDWYRITLKWWTGLITWTPKKIIFLVGMVCAV
jgi:hypothetical protein